MVASRKREGEDVIHMRTKAELRRDILERRRRRAPQDLEEAGRGLAAVVQRLLSDLPGVGPIAAYLELPGEVPTLPLLVEIASRGRQVLLPGVLEDRTLSWVLWDGMPSADRRHGAPAPRGIELGVSALVQAEVVLVPAVAVDRRGNRVGRGGGSYDRTIGDRANGAPAVAVVWEDEVLDEVPVEQHDCRVDLIATPTGLIEVAA
ncbi:MAG: 5-formyltetrahydrofolate cyclo-ligase [Actinomycetales bacterium]